MKIYPREGYLRSGGYRLHYLLWGGSGPKLVLLHSMGMDAHGFDRFAGALRGEYQVLAFDILDHGDSDKPGEAVGLGEHAEILRGGYRQLGFVPSVLIGHSVGGMMGMILAAEHPDELRGLALVDIAPFDPSTRPKRPFPPEYFPDEEEARDYIRGRYPRFTPEAVENRMRHAFVRDEGGRLRLKGTGEAIRPGLAADLWPYVERIETPTLLILGSDSDLVTNETVERMKSTMPSLEVVTVEGATHMVPQDKPEEFEGHVRAFLRTLGL
ncbi:MAG: alpha/beta hydrolase [Candidatus Bathyarchaeota archaeon]|nr:alpha/beta hydrolase [Candidatus Bathyarchaeota archaeon]